MNETVQSPTIRVRISHDKTSKGWRCNETTVEITGSVNDYPDMVVDLESLLVDVHTNGLTEANRRNSLEGFTN